MKLTDLNRRHTCFECSYDFISNAPTFRAKNDYGDWDCVECPKCGGDSKHYGYVTNFSMGGAKDRINEQRRTHRKELTQPYRQGEFSKEYKDYYPEQSRKMVKEGAITQKQHDNAKKVWGNEDVQ